MEIRQSLDIYNGSKRRVVVPGSLLYSTVTCLPFFICRRQTIPVPYGDTEQLCKFVSNVIFIKKLIIKYLGSNFFFNPT